MLWAECIQSCHEALASTTARCKPVLALARVLSSNGRGIRDIHRSIRRGHVLSLHSCGTIPTNAWLFAVLVKFSVQFATRHIVVSRCSCYYNSCLQQKHTISLISGQVPYPSSRKLRPWRLALARAALLTMLTE